MAQSGNVTAIDVDAGDHLEAELRAAAAREAALMLLLREVAAIVEAQHDVLAMLGREVTGTSEFVEARVSAICGQLRRLLPAAANAGPISGAMKAETAQSRESRVQASDTPVDTRIGHAVSSLITEVQFQDRARQRLQFVTDTLLALAECSSEIDKTITIGLHQSPESLPERFIEFTARTAQDSLRRIHARVAACVPEGGPQAVYGGEFPSDEGVVDLF